MEGGGLSGGQKRRVSLGIELLAQPRMLFLDEPTSGLDSASAYAIMTSVRKYARATQTPVLCTIHQPSELLFELGDNLVCCSLWCCGSAADPLTDQLLLSGGKEVFFGPLNQIEPHFNG
jgi:ABC-type Mn2+/Zn2+ transport system ATPase subunit